MISNAQLAEDLFWLGSDTKDASLVSWLLRWEDRGGWKGCLVGHVVRYSWSFPSWCTCSQKIMKMNLRRLGLKMCQPGKRVKPSPNPSVAISRWSCCWGKSPFANLQSREKNVFVPCFTFVAPFMASCNRANPSTGLGRLGSLSAILVKLVGSFLLKVDVMLRRLAAKPLNGFGFLVTNFPFLGIGVVNTGTWKKGWLPRCSTRPSAVVPVLTPGKFLYFSSFSSWSMWWRSWPCIRWCRLLSMGPSWFHCPLPPCTWPASFSKGVWPSSRRLRGVPKKLLSGSYLAVGQEVEETKKNRNLPGHRVISKFFEWSEAWLGRAVDAETPVHGRLLGARSHQAGSRHRVHWRWSLQTWSRSVPPGVAVLFVVPTVTWQLGLEEICVESKLERSWGRSWTRAGRVGWQ